MFYLFWVSVFLLLLSYAGYPLLLAIPALLNQGRSKAKRSFFPSLTLLISVYNEEKIIASKLQNSLALDYPEDKLSIVVVSDGSTDGTDDMVRKFAAQGVRLKVIEGRRGKTHALNQVIPNIASDIIVFSDANTMYEPQAVKRLAAHFQDPDVGAVCGELALKTPDSSVKTEGIYWRYEQMIKILESRTGSLTTFNGAIYAIRRNLHQTMIPGAANDFQHALQLARQKVKTVYEPEAKGWEDAGADARVEFRRRVRIISRGWRALLANATVLNPFRAGFYTVKIICHKLLRWLGPLFMISALIANLFILETVFYQIIAVGQLCFYLLALVGGTKLAIGSMQAAFYFCLINSAALIGLIRFLAGKDSSTWTPTTHGREIKN